MLSQSCIIAVYHDRSYTTRVLSIQGHWWSGKPLKFPTLHQTSIWMLMTHVRFGLGQSEIIGTSGGCVGRFGAPLATISTNDCPQTFCIPGWSRVERTVGCSSGSVLQSFALIFLPWILNKFKSMMKTSSWPCFLSSDLQFGNCICRWQTDLSLKFQHFADEDSCWWGSNPIQKGWYKNPTKRDQPRNSG